MPTAYLDTLANDLLDDALAGLARTRTGRKPPERTLVSHGPPVADECCDAVGGQLSVHLDNLDHRPIDRPRCQFIATAEFHVVLFRCVPTVGDGPRPLPDADVLDTSAGDLLGDLWAMLSYLHARALDGDLFGGATCNAVTMGQVLSIAPGGGCAGWDLTVTLDLSDPPT